MCICKCKWRVTAANKILNFTVLPLKVRFTFMMVFWCFFVFSRDSKLFLLCSQEERKSYRFGTV